jgi:small conductance mechanosensitive channel
MVRMPLLATAWPTLAESITAAALAVIGIVAGRVVRSLVSRAARGDDGPVEAAEFVGRFVGLILAGICLVYALGLLGVSLGPLVGTLGIGGLAFAFAGQSILANFLASIILQLRHPFRRGDQVAVGADCEGTVDDVNFRTVVLRTFDGEKVMVPCADVLANPITNHTTLGRRRTTLELSVGYDADLEQALAVLRKALSEAKGVLERPAPEVWVKSFEDSGIGIAARYWHAPDVATLWRVRSAVAVAAKRALDEAGIEIPFPQRVLRFAVDNDQSWRADRSEASPSRD